ncbi:MAG: hypothetical protein AB7O96_04345 [Pseudobdellovibrionaceae bacterium]
MKNFTFVWLAILTLSVSMVACGKKKKAAAVTPVNPLTVSCSTCFASGALLAKAGGTNGSLRLELDLFGDPKVAPPAGFQSTDPEPLRWYGLYGAVPISATGILTMFGSGMGNSCGIMPGQFTIRPVTVGTFEQRSINGLILEGLSQTDGRRITLRLDNVWLVSVAGGPASRTTNNILAAANGYGSGALILETVYGQPCNRALLLY